MALDQHRGRASLTGIKLECLVAVHHGNDGGPFHPVRGRPFWLIPIGRRSGAGDFHQITAGGGLVLRRDAGGLIERGEGRTGGGSGFRLDGGLIGGEEGRDLRAAGIVGGVLDGRGDAGDGEGQRVTEVVGGRAGGEEEGEEDAHG